MARAAAPTASEPTTTRRTHPTTAPPTLDARGRVSIAHLGLGGTTTGHRTSTDTAHAPPTMPYERGCAEACLMMGDASLEECWPVLFGKLADIVDG